MKKFVLAITIAITMVMAAFSEKKTDNFADNRILSNGFAIEHKYQVTYDTDSYGKYFERYNHGHSSLDVMVLSEVPATYKAYENYASFEAVVVTKSDLQYDVTNMTYVKLSGGLWLAITNGRADVQ